MKNKIAIVTAPFYQHIVEGLYQGAQSKISKADFDYERIDVAGALEIPLACQNCWQILKNTMRLLLWVL
jgi:6,7-dimethyl-8-ribityllumazine synthase